MAGSKADFGCPSLMKRDVRRPVAALEFLAGAAWTWIVAARSRRCVSLGILGARRVGDQIKGGHPTCVLADTRKQGCGICSDVFAPCVR